VRGGRGQGHRLCARRSSCKVGGDNLLPARDLQAREVNKSPQMRTSGSHQVPIHRTVRAAAYARRREAEMARNGAMVACGSRSNVQKRKTVQPHRGRAVGTATEG